MSNNMTELLRKVDVTLAEIIVGMSIDISIMEAVLGNLDPKWDGYTLLSAVKQRTEEMKQKLQQARKDVEIVE